jgi:hypothetical protein
MAKTLKAMVFHDIEEVELLIKTLYKSETYIDDMPKEQRDMLLDLIDILDQVREMFLKETKNKE